MSIIYVLRCYLSTRGVSPLLENLAFVSTTKPNDFTRQITGKCESDELIY